MVTYRNKNAPEAVAGPELYAQVRAAFVARGSSLNAWCLSSLVARQYVRKCLLGEANGPSARRLRKRLLHVIHSDSVMHADAA